MITTIAFHAAGFALVLPVNIDNLSPMARAVATTITSTDPCDPAAAVTVRDRLTLRQRIEGELAEAVRALEAGADRCTFWGRVYAPRTAEKRIAVLATILRHKAELERVHGRALDHRQSIRWPWAPLRPGQDAHAYLEAQVAHMREVGDITVRAPS